MSGVRKRAYLVALSAAAIASLGGASAASAAVPSFSRCPTSNPDVATCVVIQSTGGFLKMNNTTVDLGSSIKIEGGLKFDPVTFAATFVPPTSGSALTAQPVDVPGGLLGIPLPLGPLNAIKATAKLVGSIGLNFDTYDLSLPIKVKLDNPIIGPNCQIASSSSPINLDTITGTTNPPPPNTPVSGHVGDVTFPTPYITKLGGSVNVDNSFSVSSANSCGWLGGLLVNPLVNLKVGLPSAAGRNATSITSDTYLEAASDVVAGH